MEDIIAPHDASVTLYSEDFKADVLEKVSKVMVIECQNLIMKFLRKIDTAVSESGVQIWPIDPDNDLLDWYFTVDWEHLKHETITHCARVAHSRGEPYDAEALASIKTVRDRFAELVAILDGELFAGKPSEQVMKQI